VTGLGRAKSTYSLNSGDMIWDAVGMFFGTSERYQSAAAKSWQGKVSEAIPTSYHILSR